MPLYEFYTDPQSALCASGFIKSVYHDEAGRLCYPLNLGISLGQKRLH